MSPLAATDPELIDIVDNFAFDEVLQRSAPDVRIRLMVQLAAILASQAVREYRAMLAATLNVGVTPVEAKEIVYQAVAYVGLAKVLEFIHLTNDVLTERGVRLPVPAQSRTTPQDRLAKGLEVQKQIVGDEVVERLYASAPARAGDIVWFEPDEKHRHGASPTTAMTHIAIAEMLDGKAVEWMEQVTDEQYGQ